MDHACTDPDCKLCNALPEVLPNVPTQEPKEAVKAPPGPFEVGTKEWAYALELGPIIGDGSYKNCYSVKNNSDLVVLKSKPNRNGTVGEQAFVFAQLIEVGVKTPEIYYCDEDLCVMKRYPYHNRIVGIDQKEKVASEKTITSATEIIEALRKHKFDINDWQYLIDHDGSIVITDPMNVIPASMPRHLEIDLYHMVKAAYKKIGKKPEGIWAGR